MKKIILYTLFSTLLSLHSCAFFDLDNYDEPQETLVGEVVDVATGKRILTDQGSEGIRVRLTELSWGENVDHNPDFYCMPDGSFQNTKLFAGNYHIDLAGPFIPLIREDENGNVLADESKTMDIKGTTNVKFEVQPFLNIEWVDEPTVVDGKVKARIRVKRGVDEATFRSKIEPMGGYSPSFLYLTDIQFFVSYSSSVGYRARDERWSSKIEYTGDEFETEFGKVITLESNDIIPAGRTVFVRAAARINYATPVGSGTRRWNYNEAKEVLIPR
ncbi:DUF3823 domain-containing protein [Bacteroides coprosuis]|uniref:DUF3823 domain-containing protein n=1 Tax=Bacteroides coprosuis TaxID=151276 RepID=UPI001DDB96BD|nr:DUF3823 domain-containing protein [Bacteroides coprosuis]HJD93138.1 DUF3823 domain-containing protein [Bacteroides coprosuis]